MVDLPAPFGPMMPSASPAPTENDTSRTAQNSSSTSSSRTARPDTRRTIDGIRSRRLS